MSVVLSCLPWCCGIQELGGVSYIGYGTPPLTSEDVVKSICIKLKSDIKNPYGPKIKNFMPPTTTMIVFSQGRITNTGRYGDILKDFIEQSGLGKVHVFTAENLYYADKHLISLYIWMVDVEALRAKVKEWEPGIEDWVAPDIPKQEPYKDPRNIE